MSPSLRPFRFAVQLHVNLEGAALADLARRIEAAGYDAVTMADHVDEASAPLPALAAVAAATTRLRVGCHVLCNDFRHPVLVAREAATLDQLSGGRFDLGLGAGWQASDYDQMGVPMDSPGVRIARLAEAASIIRGAWTGEPYVHEGDHYRVAITSRLTEPLTAGGPPLWMGGGGRKMLELAARVADVICLNVNLASGAIGPDSGPDGTEQATLRKLGWIRAAAGDRFDDLTLSTRVHLALVTDDRRGVAEAMAGAFGLTPDEALASPHALVGTVDELVTDLCARRERFGISHVVISADAWEPMQPVVARLAGR